MIRQILHQTQRAKRKTHLSWRQLCAGQVPYASLMRWRQRQRQTLPLWQAPGPKKSVPLNWAQFYPLLRQLHHGRLRSHRTRQLYQDFAPSISRRQLAGLVQDYRQGQLLSMKHIHWLWAGLAWSCDATEYADGLLLVPVQDLASRYRFAPLVCAQLNGQQIAAHLEKLFLQHGPPLLLKRDNGSPFNCQAVEQVIARFGVLPLNNPPHFPRYNGGMEKGIRDFKAALDRRLENNSPSLQLALAAEVTAHELNHQPRRCLKGRTACAAFFDEAQRLRWTRRQRATIFRLLLHNFGVLMGNMPNRPHTRPATLWRVTVETWLRRQGLIRVRQNQKQNVSTTLSKIWSHN
ncbi:MAG TPA: transposase family protein [Pyrinomonadaceae bacterium]